MDGPLYKLFEENYRIVFKPNRFTIFFEGTKILDTKILFEMLYGSRMRHQRGFSLVAGITKY